MEVILLERVPKLGQMGEVVRVRDGYGRNYLLARGKALRATEANRKRFEDQRAQLEARNLEAKGEAEKVAAKLDGMSVILIRQAGESGVLYGSVTGRDISAAVTDAGVSINKNQIHIASPIKALGLSEVQVMLHPEVTAKVTVNVAPLRRGSRASGPRRGGQHPRGDQPRRSRPRGRRGARGRRPERRALRIYCVINVTGNGPPHRAALLFSALVD